MVRHLGRFSIFIFFLGNFLSTSLAFGQEKTEISAITPGSQISAVTKIPLRESAPAEGIFYQLAKKIGEIQEGEDLIVTEVKKVKTLLAEQCWIQVKRPKAKLKPEEIGSGWVFAGNSGEKSCCFAIKE